MSSEVRTTSVSTQLDQQEERVLIDGLNERVWKNVWQGKWPYLLTLAIEARDRADRIQYLEGLAKASLNLGLLYRLQSDIEHAREALERSQALYRALGDEAHLAEVYVQQGRLFAHCDAHDKAMEAVLLAREIFSKLGDIGNLASTYTNLGNNYAALEQYDAAGEQFEKAIALYRQCGARLGYARSLANLARVAQFHEEFERSRDLQLEALEIMKEHNDDITRASVLINLGMTYNKMGDRERSLESIREALQVADANGYRRAQYVANLAYVETYLAMGELTKARQYADEAKQLAASPDLRDLDRNLWEIEAQLYAAEGKFESAYHTLMLSQDSRLHLVRANVQHAINVKLAHYKFERAVEQRKELEERNRLLQELNEQKDSLLQIVSHDMRNPLGFIIGMGNLLSTEPEHDPAGVRDIGSLIEDTGQRLLVLVNNLLNIARLEKDVIKLDARLTSIQSMFEETERLLRPLAKNKGITLTIDVLNAVRPVEIDEPKVQQVISNILSNAVKFTPIGGKIDVYATTDSEGLSITVQDSGIGMTDEQLDHLFEKYSEHRRQGTNGEKGIGLGMTIIKSFVDLHGGSVLVHSRPQEGTTVVVTIPNR